MTYFLSQRAAFLQRRTSSNELGFLISRLKFFEVCVFVRVRLTLAGSSAAFCPSSAVSGAVGTETGSSGDLAFPACPNEAVLTWGFGRLPPRRMEIFLIKQILKHKPCNIRTRVVLLSRPQINSSKGKTSRIHYCTKWNNTKSVKISTAVRLSETDKRVKLNRINPD